MKKSLYRFAFTVLALSSLMGLTAQAQETDIPQTQIEVGAGLNTIVPYGSVRLNHGFVPHWSGVVALQGGPAFTKTPTGNPWLPLNPVATAGVKYHFHQRGWFQPFLGADLGLAWVPDRVNPYAGAEMGIFGQLGAGADLVFSPHWGLSLGLRSNLNLLNRSLMSGTLTLRPEINSIWRF